MVNAIPRQDVSPSQWDTFVEEHPRGWFYHTNAWLSYCLAYDATAVDHSFVLADDGEIVALVPLIQEGNTFTMGGHPGAPPLYRPDVPQIQATYHLRALQIAEKHGVRRWLTRSNPLRINVPNADSWQTHVVDLRPDTAILWKNIRKSYRSLIRGAQKKYLITSVPDLWAVDHTHEVHTAAAGRETRPQETWDLMDEWARDGHLLVARVYEQQANPVKPLGYAMAIRYKNAAYYASGATLIPDLSHALIWELMLTLRQGDVRALEVGWAERPDDDDKDVTIAWFKSGFGGELQTIAVDETLYSHG